MRQNESNGGSFEGSEIQKETEEKCERAKEKEIGNEGRGEEKERAIPLRK